MINLLPPQTKEDLLYARRNSGLLRWSILLGGALVGMLIIAGGGYMFLVQETKSYEKRTQTANVQLEEQKIQETQQQVEEISNNVKLVTQVLSREILFSKLLTQLGASLPPNTTLSQLQIDDLQGGLTITAQASDVNTGTLIQVNLEDPNNKIFEKADIESIVCESSAGVQASAYPCKVQVRALFAKENPFLYITTPTKEKTP